MRIYFAGSIRGGRDEKDNYLKLINHLATFGEVLTEHVGHKDVEKIMSSGSFTIEMSAREQLFEKTLPSIKKDTEDMFNGNESKMEKVLGEEKANEIVTNRIRGEKALDQIKRTK